MLDMLLQFGQFIVNVVNVGTYGGGICLLYTKRCLDILHVVGRCLLEMFEINFDVGFEGIKMEMEVFYIIW